MPWIFNFGEAGPQQIVSLLGKAPFCTLPASLPAHKVVFKGRSRKWNGGVASLEKSRKSFVYGTAMLISPEDLKIFDHHYKGYSRAEYPIFIDATQDKVKAFSYIMDGEAYESPSADYVKATLKHLKFFWGQGQKNLSLNDFGIVIDAPTKEVKTRTKVMDVPIKAEPQKRTRRRRAKNSK